ncbi:MAG: ribonuclease P protein component [Alphaproteobacteria bacterium]|nr:ribonuclease P protein component [Alphaproteobacteria bacterium]
MRRLKTRAEFVAAARGRRASRSGLVVQAISTGVDDTGVGFTVTKKAGNAPERNRIKRRLRAAAEACADAFSSRHDYVVIGRRDVLSAPFETLVTNLQSLIARVHGQKPSNRPETHPNARQP